MKILTIATVLSTFAAAAAGQQINDAQIASIVVTANQVDIDAGRLAEQMSAAAEIKAFGRRMVAEHEGVNKAAVALATKLKLTPQDNPTSQSLKAGGEKNIGHLKTLKGTAFDKAYIDNEITYHQQVLDALDKTLIPNAKNPELKTLLESSRPAFVAHLEHAKELQKTLK